MYSYGSRGWKSQIKQPGLRSLREPGSSGLTPGFWGLWPPGPALLLARALQSLPLCSHGLHFSVFSLLIRTPVTALGSPCSRVTAS